MIHPSVADEVIPKESSSIFYKMVKEHTRGNRVKVITLLPQAKFLEE